MEKNNDNDITGFNLKNENDESSVNAYSSLYSQKNKTHEKELLKRFYSSITEFENRFKFECRKCGNLPEIKLKSKNKLDIECDCLHALNEDCNFYLNFIQLKKKMKILTIQSKK